METCESFEIISRGPGRTEELGRLLGAIVPRGTYIALCGELGGGKTTFVRGLAVGMGATENVSSPTFVIMKEYSGRMSLFHTDFYRLEMEYELTGLELEDCLARGVVAAEWADKFDPPQPAPVLALTFTWLDEDIRSIRITPGNKTSVEIADRYINEIKKYIG